jgi:hypothetical protein
MNGSAPTIFTAVARKRADENKQLSEEDMEAILYKNAVEFYASIRI